MLASRLGAIGVDMQRMVVNSETAFGGSFFLARLDGRIKELLNPAALQTHYMVMVLALVEFKHRLAALEVVPHQQSGLLELGQHTVNRGQPHIVSACQQSFVYILRTQMVLVALLKQAQYLKPRQGRFQSGILEMIGRGHGQLSIYFRGCANHIKNLLQMQMRMIIISYKYFAIQLSSTRNICGSLFSCPPYWQALLQ